MTAPVLMVKDLTVGYGGRPLLSGLNLEVHSGEYISLIGPNGVGKSTLLKTIARIQKPIAGRVLLCGDDVAHMNQTDMARRLSMVLTDRVDLGALTAGLLIELGRYAHTDWTGRLRDRDRRAVTRAIDAAGVGHLVHREVAEISDGERQRVMIARALAQEPQLMLLDEPTAFLDAPSRAELAGLLRYLASTEGIAIVTSTHDLDIALRVADTTWLMLAEGTVQVGASEDLLLTGEIERAFENKFVKFDPASRSFNIHRPTLGMARIFGSGLPAVLSRVILERAGFSEVDGENGASPDVSIFLGGSEPGAWRGEARGGERSAGSTMRELAAFIAEIAASMSAMRPYSVSRE